jgi:anti-sigma factor ChrR (cupin superfamily)
MNLFVSHIDDAPVRHVADGIRTRRLWGEPGRPRALLVELDAGLTWPELDVHEPGPELVYVLSGDFSDGDVVHEAGTFLRYEAGTSHQPSTVRGCRMLVFYPEG